MFIIIASIAGEEIAAITSSNKNVGFARMRQHIGALSNAVIYSKKIA